MSLVLTAALPSFLASLVEFVEALTIVLAVGTACGWRAALLGAAGGTVFLAAIIAGFGPLLGRVPLQALQLVVGALLLLFGVRWLRKAILRYAGRIPLHDEAKIYAAATERLHGTAARAPNDWPAIATTFNAVVLEGLEVVFIVVAVGATASALGPAVLGAAGALVIVVVAGFALRAPLARVPENTLKFAVGIMLSSFGVYWTAEGLRFEWPGGDVALLAVIATFLLGSAVAVALLRRQPRPSER